MIKAESKGGERSLRSASPHRNAYKSDFHAIKCTFDGPKSEGTSKTFANGSTDTREDSRGRPFGTRVNKIKNIFLQMDCQQQECQEGKVTLKSEVPQVSPPKVQFPASTHRVNFNNTTSPESNILDKTPKGEDAEIDKVALAEKFSVTRKLFERGIKEQPATEKQSPNRVVNRLSLGSASDEGKNTRRVSGSSETTIKSEQTATSTAKSQTDEKADGEKRHTSRASLNAGPMSKRLGNYMAENDSEDNNTAAAKGGLLSAKQHSTTEHILPTSPTKDSLHKPTSPVRDASDSSVVSDTTNRNKDNKPTSPGSNVGPKPTFPLNKAADAPHKPLLTEQTTLISQGHKSPPSSGDVFSQPSAGHDEGTPQSPPSRDVKQPSPSAGGFQNASTLQYSEKAKSNDTVVHSQTSSLHSRGVGMVRAELVVVQNESSESEENEDENVEDNVFEEQKGQSDLKRTFPAGKQNCGPAHQTISRDDTKEAQRVAETVAEGRVQEDKNDIGLKKERQEDSLLVNQVDEDDEEAEEEEGEREEQVDRESPVVCGIENAAFVDDRDVDQILREEEEEEEAMEEEEEEENQMYKEYDDCYEAPGLSEEDEPTVKRKIRFSTEPILVSTVF